jgi:signal transduction histidine kinase
MWSKSYADKLPINRNDINIGDAIKESIYLLEPTASNKNIQLSADVVENMCGYADENMIKTVLRNLITNAIKFTNEGGYVKISGERTGKEIKVVVEDNGIGIDDTVKATLFNLDEFVSAEGTAGERGSGFGLVLCKEFIDKNNGKIWVESEVGKGSKFMFTVPACS